MLKKTLIIVSIVLGVITIGLAVVYFFVRKSHAPVDSLLVLVPGNTVFLIETRDPSGVLRKWSEVDGGVAFSQWGPYRRTMKDWMLLDSLLNASEASRDFFKDEPLKIAALPADDGAAFEYLYIFRLSGQVSPSYADRFILGLDPGITVENENIEGFSVRVATFPGSRQRFYYYAGRGFFVGAQNLSLLQKSLEGIRTKGIENDEAFMKIYKPVGNVSDVQLTLHWGRFFEITKQWFSNGTYSGLVSAVSGWASLGCSLEKNHIRLKGFTAAEEGSVLKKLPSESVALPLDLVPSGAVSALSLSLGPVESFVNSAWEQHPLAINYASPACYIGLSSGASLWMLETEEDPVTEALPAEYKGYMVYACGPDWANGPFPWETEHDSVFVAREGERLVISPDLQALKTWIDNYISGFTMAAAGLPETNNDGAMTWMFFPGNLSMAGREALWTKAPSAVDSLAMIMQGLEISWKPKGELLETHVEISFALDNASQLMPERSFEIPVGFTERLDILNDAAGNILGYAIWDSLQNMAFIDSSGTVKWKRNFDAFPPGEIYSVLLTEQKIPALVFSTYTGIQAITAEGKNVEGYPLGFPSEIQAPLAVVKYDAQTDYRYFFSMKEGKKNKIYLWDPLGQPVAGWTPVETTLPVTEPIQYIQVAGRDYIYFSETDGTVHLVDRPGKTHLLLNSKINPDRNGPLIPVIKTTLLDSYIAYSTSEGKMEMLFFDRGKEKMEHEIPAGSVLLKLEDLDANGTRDLLVNHSGDVKWVDYKTGETKFSFSTGNPTGVEVHLVSGKDNTAMLIFEPEAHRIYGIDKAGSALPGFPLVDVKCFKPFTVKQNKREWWMILTGNHELFIYPSAF